MSPFALSLIFFAACMLAVAGEMWIPSFGALAVLAVILGLMSVYHGFADSWSMGFMMLGANMTGAAVAIALALHYMKGGPLSNRADVRPHRDATEPTPAAAHPWLGREGVALTPLTPGGQAEIAGERIDVLSRDGYLEAGTPVRVVAVEGRTIKVAAASPL